MSIKYYTVFFLAALTITSCQTEELGDCFDIPPYPDGNGLIVEWDYESRPVNFHMPVFHPSDHNIFFYLRSENLAGEIRWHNLATGQDEFITDQTPYYQLKANSNGDLAFNDLQGFVWTVKMNGDSLRRITDMIHTFYPDWTDDGTAIVYYKENTITDYYFIKINRDGERIDTLDFINVKGTPPHSCSQDGNFLAMSPYADKKYIYNLSNQTVKIISHAIFDPTQDYVVSWFPDNSRIAWTSSKGIHITDIEQETTNTITEGCDSKRYIYPSISSNGNKIISLRIDKMQTGPTTLYLESNIVIMNTDGSGEKIIDLPQ